MRTVFDEKVKTYFESGNGAVNWRYLLQSNEILWFSERNNWGNLYLYDAGSGRLNVLRAEIERRHSSGQAGVEQNPQPDFLAIEG